MQLGITSFPRKSDCGYFIRYLDCGVRLISPELAPVLTYWYNLVLGVA